VLAVVGAVLPWTGAGLIDGVGLGGREIVALLMGIVAVGVLYVADWTESAQLIAALLGLVTTGVAGYTLAEALGVIGSGTASPSLGLYVTLLAGLLLLGGGVHTYTDSTPEAGMYSHR
jgi:hypothetical protein